MTPYAVDDDHRRRLVEAQRAEAAALQAATVARRRRQRLQAKVDAADAELGEAHRALVEACGFQRAVLLTGAEPSEVRRLLRCATTATRSPGIPASEQPTDDR